MIIDLHLHSYFSDGEFSPSDVINFAHNRNVRMVSLTDHDSILGLDEARKVAKSNKMIFVDGVELEAYIDISTCKYVHLLAYNFQDNHKMMTYLNTLKSERLDLVHKYVKLLQSQNFKITFEDVNSLTPGSHLTSSHIAVWLYKNGIYPSYNEAKNNYLVPGSKNYIPTNYHTIEELIKLVLDCGGIPILAHPYRIGYDNAKLDYFISYLKTLGLKGIESYYGDHSKEQIDFCLKLSHKYNLVSTGGSDWHDFTCSPIGIIYPYT